MKTYKKPEIELSSFDTDIIATSDGTLTVAENAYEVTNEKAVLNFVGTDGNISIDPFNN